MEPDGGLTGSDGSGVPWPEARPEVAWGTSDLFRAGAPVAAFFRFLVDCPSLRWFQSPAAGYDSAPFHLLADRGVRVCNAHVNSLPIAEFVLRAVLDEFQGAAEWRRQAEAFEWRIHDWREVSGTTWLVVGLGHIGGAVAVRARALGATVIGCRRTPGPDDPADRTVTPDRLGEVIGEADVVVLSAPAVDGHAPPRRRRLPGRHEAGQRAGERRPGHAGRRGRAAGRARLGHPVGRRARRVRARAAPPGPPVLDPSHGSGSPPTTQRAVSAGSAARPTCSPPTSTAGSPAGRSSTT